MFGFIIEQPIHHTIRQLRIFTVLLLLVSVDIMYRLITILENASELSPTQTVGAVAVLAATIFAAIWKGIGNLAEAHKKDE